MRESFNMVTRRPAEMIRLADYGLAVGKAADLVVLDAVEPEMALQGCTRSHVAGDPMPRDACRKELADRRRCRSGPVQDPI